MRINKKRAGALAVAALKGVACGGKYARQCSPCYRIRDLDLKEHCLAQCEIDCERTAPECQ